MKPFYYTLLALVWGLIPLCLMARWRKQSLDAAVVRGGSLFPPFAIASCLAVFWLTPAANPPPATIIRAIHYAGIILLGLFLAFGSYCQIEAWMRRGGRTPAELAGIYYKWWMATKLMPAPAAICILLSGIRLAYESSDKGNLFQGWLFWLIVGFSFFFFDGLLSYLPEIGCLKKASQNAASQTAAGAAPIPFKVSRWQEIMFAVHSVSFPFVFALGCAKPDRLWVPNGLLAWLLSLFSGWDQSAARSGRAAVLVLIVGLVLLVVRLPRLIKCIRFLNAPSR